MSILDKPYFRSEKAARAHLERIRWAHGPICPHCGGFEKIYNVKSKAARPGLYKCGQCRKQFTVTVGTLFERSKVPLHKWFQAAYLLCSSKKGISSHQLHRILGVTYQTAWFMSHRLREAMKDDPLFPDSMGGKKKVIEADETYFGGRPEWVFITDKGWQKRRGPVGKRAIVALVERGGKTRTFHVKNANAKTVREILVKNVSRKSELHTDESRIYTKVGREFAGHKTVTHSADEYVGPEGQHTNTVEGFFSIFKRGMKGVYQHCGEKHLHRYLSEFDFRYNNRKVTDWDRTIVALKGIEGRRLTYRHS